MAVEHAGRRAAVAPAARVHALDPLQVQPVLLHGGKGTEASGHTIRHHQQDTRFPPPL